MLSVGGVEEGGLVSPVDAVTPLAAASSALRRAPETVLNSRGELLSISPTTTNHDSGYSSGTALYLLYKHHHANNQKRLGRWLDRPLFPWKRLVVGFSLAEFALENWLLFRQYRVLQRTSVPKALNKEIDTETFDKSQVCILIA
jgi:hypothetical protein